MISRLKTARKILVVLLTILGEKKQPPLFAEAAWCILLGYRLSEASIYVRLG